MDLIWMPQSPYHLIALTVTLLSCGLLLVGRLRAGKTRTKKPLLRELGFWAGILALILITAALFRPSLVSREQQQERRLVVVLDLSDSTLRGDGGYRKLLNTVADRVDSVAEGKDQSTAIKADLISFRGEHNQNPQDLDLANFAQALRGLSPDQSAGGAGTNIEAALQAAIHRLRSLNKPGEIWLFSDGNQTQGDALEAAARAAAQGFPITVTPLTSPEPELAVTAADLPERVVSGNQTLLRGMIRNSGIQTAEARLSIVQNPVGEAARDLEQSRREGSFQLTADSWARFREPLNFRGFGLQYTELSLSNADGIVSHQRRFFTFVDRPPRYLSIGGDHRWARAFSEEAAEITAVSPEDTANLDINEFDAVILSGVPADRFPFGKLEQIAVAVRDRGLGLFLANGDHEGNADNAPSILQSYVDTPIEPLLPVIPGPRPFTPDPPGRHVSAIIDTSGSMGGWKLEKSKQIMRHIITELLRPVDRLDIIAFSGGTTRFLDDEAMDADGKEQALAVIESLQAGGGTDPAEALQLIAERQTVDCGLIFISDGEFNALSFRPDCRATVFAVGSARIGADSPLRQLSDPFAVEKEFDPAAIQLPYFQPKPRNKYFEPGRFQALVPRRLNDPYLKLSVPPLPLPGSAVARLKPGQTATAYRPKLTDPVLVVQGPGVDAPAGTVIFFASGFNQSWTRSQAGTNAIRDWIERLPAFSARDRYGLNVEDLGDRLRLSLWLKPKQGRIPEVSYLEATVGNAEQERHFSLRPDLETPGGFIGDLLLPEGDQPERVLLSLREAGKEALPRTQKLPMLLPPAQPLGMVSDQEAYTYGRNVPLLRELAAVSGGRYDPDIRSTMSASRGQDVETELWPWLAAAALLLQLIAVVVRRLEP